MEVPMKYVKTNQAGIVLFIIASMLTTPWILFALWVIQVLGLLSGGRLNLFVRIAKPLLPDQPGETQAAELTRFNNTLAVTFLTLALAAFAFGWTIAGYVFAAMLLLAAGVALLGYCIGCTMYFQFKQLRHRLSAK